MCSVYFLLWHDSFVHHSAVSCKPCSTCSFFGRRKFVVPLATCCGAWPIATNRVLSTKLHTVAVSSPKSLSPNKGSTSHETRAATFRTVLSVSNPMVTSLQSRSPERSQSHSDVTKSRSSNGSSKSRSGSDERKNRPKGSNSKSRSGSDEGKHRSKPSTSRSGSDERRNRIDGESILCPNPVHSARMRKSGPESVKSFQELQRSWFRHPDDPEPGSKHPVPIAKPATFQELQRSWFRHPDDPEPASSVTSAKLKAAPRLPDDARAAAPRNESLRPGYASKISATSPSRVRSLPGTSPASPHRRRSAMLERDPTSAEIVGPPLSTVPDVSSLPMTNDAVCFHPTAAQGRKRAASTQGSTEAVTGVAAIIGDTGHQEEHMGFKERQSMLLAHFSQ